MNEPARDPRAEAKLRLEAAIAQMVALGEPETACRLLVAAGAEHGGARAFWAQLRAAAELLDLPELRSELERHLTR